MHPNDVGALATQDRTLLYLDETTEGKGSTFLLTLTNQKGSKRAGIDQGICFSRGEARQECEQGGGGRLSPTIAVT